MRLFAVRLTKDKQAVGFFWAAHPAQLWWMIDAVCDPGDCEFHRVKSRAAVVWESPVKATLGGGKNFDDEDYSGESETLAELRREISFEFSFEDYIYGVVDEGCWTKVPFADEPGGGLREMIQNRDKKSRRKTKTRKASRKKK